MQQIEVHGAVAPRRWRRHQSNIRLSLTSDGTSGAEWVARLAAKGYAVESLTESLLRSPIFVPTQGVTTVISVLRGGNFTDEDRTIRYIKVDAKSRALAPVRLETACLIWDAISEADLQAMGLDTVIPMHTPVMGDRRPRRLHAHRLGERQSLCVSVDQPDRRWNRRDGFAFAVTPGWW